jgi:hypothetical protein
VTGSLRSAAGATRVVAVVAITLVAAGVATGVAVTGEDSQPAKQVRFGFNNNAVSFGQATAEQAASAIAAAGGTIDRVQIRWSDLEPRPGERHFQTFDAIYESDLRHGVRPLFILGTAPAWATDEECATAPQPCLAAPAADHYDEAAATAAAIARRYPDAAGIEVWNEPNTPYFWAPAPNPHEYSELLAVVHAAVEHAAPAMPIVGGGASSGTGGGPPGHIDGPDFASALVAEGALKNMDALSVHAYAEQSDPSGQSAVANVEAVRSAIGGATEPIWVTETGVSTTGPAAVSDEAQALALLRVSELLPEVPGVEMVLVHTLVENSQGDESPETGFGVLRPDLQPKPGYCVLAESWGGNSNC